MFLQVCMYIYEWLMSKKFVCFLLIETYKLNIVSAKPVFSFLYINMKGNTCNMIKINIRLLI